MKIEKVNEHQIRCTLTHEDLALRDIKISELAYGSDKTKKLIRDMMQKAAYEVGFEAEDIPLMIEAVPLNSECIVLVITKVEDPEELDTRFAKFAPSVHEDLYEDDDNTFTSFSGEFESDSLNASVKPTSPFSSQNVSKVANKEGLDAQGHSISHIVIAFQDMSAIMQLSEIMVPFYNEKNTLFKISSTNEYLLVLQKGSMADAEFKRIYHIATEYGKPVATSSTSQAHLEEHCETILKDSAIQTLASL